MTRSRKRKLQRLAAGGCGRRMASALPLAPMLLAGIPVAYGQATDQPAGLEEIVVTAQKQTENLQAVPMSIQALGEAKLEELRINSFADYAKYLPSVSFQAGGGGGGAFPGAARVFMRGVVSGDNGNHSGPMPSVGQYLDEQPITTIDGAVDVHVYDVERIEVLEGPQGTLYGASSQAGTIRTITNKPDPKAFSASYDLQGSYVESGNAGYKAEGYVNVPTSDSSAIRLVGWVEHQPGFIDNVLNSYTYPSSGLTVTNANRVKNNYNDVDIYGARAALKIDLNDSWSITPGLMGQVTKANGMYAYDANLGDLKIGHFNPDDAKDSWIQAALTVEGKIGDFELVYAGAYLDRNVHSRTDYSDYSYWYDVQAGYGAYIYDNNGDLINPSQYVVGKDGYTMWSNELRLSSPRDQRFRFVAGLFAQNSEHTIQQDYKINNLADTIAVTGWPDSIWLTEQTRTDKSYALFGEMYFDITEKLTATAGIRFFQTKNDLKGFFGFSQNFSHSTGESQCFPEPGYFIPNPDPNGDPIYVPSNSALWKKYNGAPCVNLNKNTDQNGNTPKLNLAYKFDADRMIYATYSEGFRPGGVNRRGDFPPYKADYLKNYEAGWKTTWAQGTFRFNGAFFLEDWNDFQFSYLGANGLTNVTNAGKARIKGVETYVDWLATDGLLLSGGVMWLDPKLEQDFCKALDENPCDPVNFAPKGTQLPVTPTFKANLVARYTFTLAGYDANVQGSYVYQNDVNSELLPADLKLTGVQPAFGIFDLSGGIKSGPYSFTLFINNLFDERADLFRYHECAVQHCGLDVGHPGTTYTGVNEPRTIGLTFRQEF
jgi:iron complex outermembrane recepter protein